MATYKTPGVYVEEVSTLPPSVAGVSTAIPAFIGYTRAGKKVVRIKSLLEYETLLGRSKPTKFKAAVRKNEQTGLTELVSVNKDALPTDPEFLMHYSLSLFFKNGGESCYVISIGDYNSKPAKADFEAGLAELEKEDEPTLIVLVDAVNLSAVDYYDLCAQAMAQCNKLGDRFTLLDVIDGDVEQFRNSPQIGTKNLMYGAAYLPYLQTSLNYVYDETQVGIGPSGGSGTFFSHQFGTNGVVVQYNGNADDLPKVKVVVGTDTDPVTFAVSSTHVLTINDVSGKTGSAIAAAWTAWKADANNNPQGFEVVIDGDGSGSVPGTANSNVSLEVHTSSITLADIKSDNTALYNQVKTALTQQRVVLPATAAIAGIYASVDRERGVWKAPANVSVSAVIGPVAKITSDDQENLNVDPTAGKSINAIRSFTGKGTLVWGARTLAGNDNEWRYVNVRRLFNYIEESAQKATGFAVFEPNDTTTWLKVKAMIESFLYGLWEQGALAGPKPDSAYFVNVGLGKTMTNQDILEGRMIVEIGVAAVRPAEFIVLRFSHKMQEA